MIWLLWLIIASGALGNLEEPDVTWSTLVTPKITGAQRVSPDGLGYPEIMNLTVGEFTLHLNLNTELISPSFKRKYYENGKEIVKENHANCFYQGTVEEHPQWRALISTCHGLIGQFGDKKDLDAMYLIKPKDKSNYAIEAPHYLYTMAEENNDMESECGTVHHNPVLRDILFEDAKNVALKKKVKRQNDIGTLYLELALIVDHAEFVIQGGSDVENVTNRMFQMVNFQDDAFRKYLNIRVVLVYMEIWTDGDKVAMIIDDMLGHLTAIQRWAVNGTNIPVSWDAVEFVTGSNYDGRIFGMTWAATICSSLAVSINQDVHSHYSKAAVTMAHELGHNIGASKHDNQYSDGQCSCPDTQNVGRCIMSSKLTYPAAVDFSNCSQAQFWDIYPNKVQYPCLDNWPHTFAMPPVCGNGFLEDGEACDCGTIEECTNPCCDPTTCTASNGSICTFGPCCNQTSCDYSERGTVCRGPVDDCDIAEYCTGTSAECPSTDYRHSFGVPCNSTDGEQSVCGANGTCVLSRNEQCGVEYSSGTGAIEACYSLNQQGVTNGHCGNDPIAAVYLPCAQKDIKCGLMQCTGSTYNQNHYEGIGSDLKPYRFGVHFEGDIYVCRTLSTSASQQLTNPGLIDNGTYCDTDKVCYNQKCTPLDDATATCASGHNGLECSGKGHCSHFGNCSCEYDTTGDACQYDFYTGDIDECLYNLDNCQSGCINTIGSFTCTCNTGYVLASNEWECEDLNECDAGVHNCHHGCVNNEGSYTCTCNTGYSLDNDGWSCSDVDECAIDNGGCDHTCTNMDGSYECNCRRRYTLTADGHTCNPTIANEGSGGQQKVPAIAGGVGGGLFVIVAIGGLVVAVAVLVMSKKNRKTKTEITPMNSVRVTDSSSRISQVAHPNLEDSDMQLIVVASDQEEEAEPALATAEQLNKEDGSISSMTLPTLKLLSPQVDQGEEFEPALLPEEQLDKDEGSIQSHSSTAPLPPEDEAAPTACSSSISFHSAQLAESMGSNKQAQNIAAPSVHPSDIQIEAILSSKIKMSDEELSQGNLGEHKLSTHSLASMHSTQEVMLHQITKSLKKCLSDNQQQPDTSINQTQLSTRQVEGAPLSTENSPESPARQQHQARPRRPSNIPVPIIQVGKPAGDGHSPTEKVRHRVIPGALHDDTKLALCTQSADSSSNKVTESPLSSRQGRPSKMPVPTSAVRQSRVAKSDTSPAHAPRHQVSTRSIAKNSPKSLGPKQTISKRPGSRK